MDRAPEEILDDLHEYGTQPTPTEIVSLCAAALECSLVTERYTALIVALERSGWTVIDTTTDDDETQIIELVPPE